MKAIDPVLWSKQESELRESDTGRDFLEFLNFWVETAEKLMEETKVVNTDFGDETFRKYTAKGAIDSAFELAEVQFTRQEPVFVSQMLALISVYWYHRDSFFTALTVIEKYYVQTALQAKLDQLGEDAKGGQD